jgi:hypothetical protein
MISDQHLENRRNESFKADSEVHHGHYLQEAGAIAETAPSKLPAPTRRQARAFPAPALAS